MKRDINDKFQIKKAMRSGFTLIELLLVVTILGVLAAVVIPNVIGHSDEAYITATRTSISTINQSVQVFAMRHGGKLPDTLDELTVGTDEKPGLLKEGSLMDAWGNDFTYTKKGKRFTITSPGPDEEIGSEDDITN